MGRAPPARSRQTLARFVVLVILLAAAVPVVAAASFSGRTGGVFGRGTGVAPGGRGKAIPSGWRRDRAAPRDKKKTSKAEATRDVDDAAAANRIASARGRVGANNARADRAVPATDTVEAAGPGNAPPQEREPARATGTTEPKAPVPNAHRKARGAGDLDQVLAAAARLRRQHELEGADAYNGAGSVVAPPEERVDLSYLVRPSAAALEATSADADDVGEDRAPPTTAASADAATTSDSTPGTPEEPKTPASASRDDPATSESPPSRDTAPGPVTRETAPDDVPPSRRESSTAAPVTGSATAENKPTCDPADDVGRRADLPPTPPPGGIVTPPEGPPGEQQSGATVVEDAVAAPAQPPAVAPEDSTTQNQQPSPDAAPGADSPRKPAPAKKVTDVSIAAIKRAAAEAKRRQQEREAAEAKALEEARKARRAEADALMAKDAAAAADIPVADHGAPSDKDQPASTTATNNTPTTTPPQSKEDL